jgi:hypothetical protein
MRIKVLVNVVTQFGQYQQGEVDLPEAQAAELLDRGWAIPLEEAAAAPVSTETAPAPRREPAELETAALGEPEETAAEPAPRRKRKGA